MNNHKKSAKIAGVLFLTAMVTSLLGGGLLESILNSRDFITNISSNTSTIFFGVSAEIINSLAVICIAVILFPILKLNNEGIAIGYVGFRIIESIFCIISAIIPLSLINLSEEYLKSGNSPAPYFQILGNLLIAVRSNLTELLVTLFFSLGALLFYSILYKTVLIPKFISVWGFIGVVLILSLIFFRSDIIINMILNLPIILNEIFLGIWLIVKRFNLPAIARLFSN
jgi:hypothetical protein